MSLRLRYRMFKSHFLLALCTVFALAAVLPLAAVLYHVTRNGAAALNIEFFTQLPRPTGEPGGGIANAIVGTGILVALATVIAVPFALLAGIFLARAYGGWLPGAVRFAADVLTGVPSIVIGVVVYELMVVPMRGFSALAGAVALAFIMVPTVVRTTEEMVRLVPRTIYEAALAMGVPQWRAVALVVLRGARAGIVTGVVLAAARVAGETAPLLFTAFNNQYWSTSLTQPIASLPVLIFDYAVSPYDDWHQKAWGASLVLLLLVLVASIVTRWVTRGRYQILQ